MKNSKNKIIVVVGDPNSINSEIIYKSWKKLNNGLKKKIYFICNYELINEQFLKLKIKQKVKLVTSVNENNEANVLKIINVKLKFKNPFNVNDKIASVYVVKCLNLAHKFLLNKNIEYLINCPINKKLLPKKNIGVTEYLANKCRIKNKSEVMLIMSKNFAVVPITTHLDLKKVDKNIKSKTIKTKIKTLQNFF